MHILTKPGGLFSGQNLATELLGDGHEFGEIFEVQGDAATPSPEIEKKNGSKRRNVDKDNKTADEQGKTDDPGKQDKVVVPDTSLTRASKLAKTLIKESSDARIREHHNHIQSSPSKPKSVLS